MRVCTFESANAPANERWLAAIYIIEVEKGKTSECRLPMIFAGPTEDSVADAASNWWQSELDKEAAKVQAAEARAEARAKRRPQVAKEASQ